MCAWKPLENKTRRVVVIAVEIFFFFTVKQRHRTSLNLAQRTKLELQSLRIPGRLFRGTGNLHVSHRVFDLCCLAPPHRPNRGHVLTQEAESPVRFKQETG